MRILIAFLLVSCSTPSFGQSTVTLSERAEISVITCGPGQEAVFTAFGHSAFRVFDPVNKINAAFNYGVFDFEQPNFYLNFARGNNRYRLAVQDYERFEYTYQYYNRYVHEQILNLTQSQKQELFDYLIWNSEGENQFYLYDYFYDNCATKIPEVMLEVFGDTVTFDGSFIKSDYTIRNLTDLYLEQQPWGDLGIDICLGLPMDKTATPYEYMFLPDYVESSFDHAFIKADGKTIPLVKEKLIKYESQPEERTANLFHPLIVFGIVLLITGFISYRDWKRKKLSKWFDTILFGITGLIGALLLLLWVATDHKAAANNYNLLWALPTNLIVAFALFKNRKWVVHYFLIAGIIAGATVLFWYVLPQQLNYMLIPLVLALAIRAELNYFLRRLNYI